MLLHLPRSGFVGERANAVALPRTPPFTIGWVQHALPAGDLPEPILKVRTVNCNIQVSV
jgi:hypothetical protein